MDGLDDFETVVKVIVVGNGGVGKSSLTARYCKGTFTDTYKKTIGVDFLEKTLQSGLASGESVKLMIWDTAGQEEFDALTASYYRGAGACAIVFSSTDRASFEAVERWKAKVEAEFEGAQPPVLALVQNKADLCSGDEVGAGAGAGAGAAAGAMGGAQMSALEVEALARRLGMRLIRTSVKQDVNVRELFEFLAVQFILRGQNAGGAGASAGASDCVDSGSGSAVGTASTSAAAASSSDAGAGSSRDLDAARTHATASNTAPASATSSLAPSASSLSLGNSTGSARSVTAAGSQGAPAAGAAGAGVGATAAASASAAPLQLAPLQLAAVPAAASASAASAGNAPPGTIKLGSAQDKDATRRRAKNKGVFAFC